MIQRSLVFFENLDILLSTFFASQESWLSCGQRAAVFFKRSQAACHEPQIFSIGAQVELQPLSHSSFLQSVHTQNINHIH